MDNGFSIGTLIYNTYEILNIFTPSIPYLFQVKKFYETNSSVGYSRQVSLLIVISSLLRIFFWFGKRFHYALLLQSIFLVMCQLYVIKVAIKYSDEKTSLTINTNSKKFYDFDWDSPLYYISILSSIVLMLTLFCIIFTFQNQIFVETLGAISSIIESTLVLPQIIENFRYQTTKNLSNVLVSCWFIGDCIKTYYFYVSQAPLQLFLGGFFQIFLNSSIVYQVIAYKKKIEFKGI